MSEDAVLLLNVGTGDKQHKEHSDYVDVLIKAVNNSGASEIVVVHSQNPTSQDIVEQLKLRLNEKYKVNIAQLPSRQMEFDADDCYMWFDELLKKYTDRHIIVDISHGTKAMSAALYAVGLHYNIMDYQYAVKKSDGKDGFITGAEIIKDFDASYARWRGVLKQCQTLFAARQYRAVKEIVLNEKTPKKLKNIVEKCVMLSDFCSAFDRFDYKGAMDNMVEFSIPELNYRYDENLKGYVKYLADEIKVPDDGTGKVVSEDFLKSNIDKAINLMFDLYANGLRRLDNAQNEDAGIRAYKMAELLGQIHLMNAGYMSDHMSSSDEKIRRFAARNGIRTSENSDIYPSHIFNRTTVIRFLSDINYDKEVTSYLEKVDGRVKSLRNKSILVHGYTARAVEAQGLAELFDELIAQTKYFISEEEFNKKMQTAMFLNNNFKAEKYE